MRIQLVNQPWESLKCDALVVPLFEDEDLSEDLPATLDQKLDGLLSELKQQEEWKGKSGDKVLIYRPPNLAAGRLLLLGAGPRGSYDTATIRQLTCRAVRSLKGFNLKRLVMCRRSQAYPERAAQAAVEGVQLGIFDMDEYKTEEKAASFIEEVSLATSEELDSREIEAAMERGRILGQATNFARSLVNQPGNRFTPSILAEKAREISEKFGLQLEVLDEPEMIDRGMNALLAVGRGSDEPARLVILKHFGGNGDSEPAAVLVGKGVTFDSGGLSLKPPKAMEDMKADKAGACAVLAAMQAIAQLQIRRNVIGLMPAVENLPSGRAQRPGDVVRSMSGKTIEVLNTDAEGRLILADALAYARQEFNPAYMVDLATLTGACVIALGHLQAGLFSNDDRLYEKIQRAGEKAGEKLWRLPLDDDYRKEIESDIADVKNVGGRAAGAVTAAKFLQEFVGDTPWCHLDIAGVDLYPEKHELKGPTGFGVRTLVELVSGE